MELKEIENNWIRNFAKSQVIANGNFNTHKAKEIFYGNRIASDPYLKKGFVKFHDGYNFNRPFTELQAFVNYMSLIGLTIDQNAILHAVKNDGIALQEIFKKGFYILKSFADNKNTVSLENPFADNQGDVYFLLNLQLRYQHRHPAPRRYKFSFGRKLFKVLGISN